MSELIKLKSCCCCLSLKTGSIICGIIYFILGILLFLQELYFSLREFSYHMETAEPNELYAFVIYDLQPSLMIAFSCFLFYGISKEHPFFIFTGVVLAMTLIFLNWFTAFIYLFRYLIYGMLQGNAIVGLLICSVINFGFLIILQSHYREIASKKKVSIFERISSRRSSDTTNNFENEVF